MDGRIPDRYLLHETPSDSYLQRTECNVRDLDGTVVFTFAKEPTGGSLKTIQFAKKHGKPCLHIGRAGSTYMPELAKQELVNQHGIKHLNVAGSRESKDPRIYLWVTGLLEDAFFWSEIHPGMLGGPGEG